MEEQIPLSDEQLPTQEPGRKKSWWRRFRNRLFLLLFIGLVVSGYFKFYFVFGEGSKAGELNFIVRKGYLFKTYEGRVIQTGYKSKVPGSIQSNEFEFSVVDEKIARQLMSNSGAFMELHYKEYLGALPWRGMSKYVVDSIISIKKLPNTKAPFE